MSKDDSIKPFTFDDLALAMAYYREAKSRADEAQKAREVEQKKIDHFQEEEDKANQDVLRHRATVRKILNNLEK